jgi:CubicO group peptidase (beta-lactamase class C family)
MTLLHDVVESIEAFVRRQMRADGTPGLALAVTDREGLLHTATFGFAEVGAKAPVTPHHLFEIGSIGKSFTSIALLQLQEEGRLDVRAPVDEYLPWFQVPSDFAPITLHHLMSHTAGITAGLDPTPESTFQVWALRRTRATTPPGTYFHYSNVGYKVLGLVLERVLGQGYGQIIQERILDPLGMTTVAPTITLAIRDRLAIGYAPFFDDRPWLPHHRLAPATWLETDTADGCLAMTAADLGTYLRMLLNRGAHPGGRLLSPASFDLLTQRVIASSGGDEPRYYGYGLVTYDVGGHVYLGHGGGMVGYFAGMIGDLDAGLGAVVLVNGPGSPVRIARAALELVRGAVEGGPPPDLLVHDEDQTLDNAEDYAGTYRSAGRSLLFWALDDRLVLSHDGAELALYPIGTDTFLADHPAFDRFLFRFQRDRDRVVEVFHGAEWLVNERWAGPERYEVPSAWRAYSGRYGSHNPWSTNCAIVLRKDSLWLIIPSEPDGFEAEQPLIPLADGSFRVGDDERGPERVRFDTIADGQAIRANLSGCDFYRVGPV